MVVPNTVTLKQSDILNDATPFPGADVALIKTQTDKINGKMLFEVNYWSTPQITVVLPAGAATQTLPNVVITALPVGMTVARAIAIFKFRCIQNAGLANALNGAQYIGVQKGGAGGFVNAITFATGQFAVAAAAVDAPGDVAIGDIDIAAKVTTNDTYNFQWTSANANVANLTFTDLQVGLRVWYSI